VKFPKAVNENLWIIDTGATDHMVHSLSCLTTVTSVVMPQLNYLMES
jgi:hypothetical protein